MQTLHPVEMQDVTYLDELVPLFNTPNLVNRDRLTRLCRRYADLHCILPTTDKATMALKLVDALLDRPYASSRRGMSRVLAERCWQAEGRCYTPEEREAIWLENARN